MDEAVDKVPDIREREEALDHARSFIVQAPAGSGKTTLLIQRFLVLLATVRRPEEVLAITFTRKAAGEMHTRIMEALRKARDGSPAGSENDEKTRTLALKALERGSSEGWSLLENPGRLRVQTIDSFCASITRQMPLLSRLGRQPLVNENPEELYTEAARRTAAMIDDRGRSGEAVRQALRYHDNSIQDLEKKVVMMLASRDQWLRHTGSELDDSGLREMLEGSIRRLVEETLREAAEEYPPALAPQLADSARYAASNLVAGGIEHAIVELNGLDGLPGAFAGDLALWKSIAGLLLTSEDTWRKPNGVNKAIGFPADKTDEAVAMKEGFKGLLRALEGRDRLLHRLAAVRRLPETRYDEEDWKTLKSLLHLLPVAVGHLMDVFSERKAVDFPALSTAAIEALGPDDAPTDLMLTLDNVFRHILVDEYQDTSWTQVTLLESLTRGWEPGDGRTLFIVGDPMQSIYLFRDAEVGLFLETRKKGIGSVELTPLKLRSNFRSQENIVQWVNDTFRGAFPGVEDVLTGAVTYADSLAVKPPLEGAQVEVNLYGERADEREASDVVEVIKKIDGADTRAVLARSRAHLKVIVQELKKEGIDFRAEDLDPLNERPVIQDLFALQRAMMHPCDRVAWLAILRARWCGLTLPDIHKICVGDTKSPVWLLMNDRGRLETLTEDGQSRISGLAGRLGKALGLKGRVPPRVLLEGLWTALGGPACYEDDDSMADAELFFDMVASVSVGGEVSSIKGLEARVEGLYATHGGKGENPVFVTTIHKAKGLEFDHVILPGLGKPPRSSEKKLLYWLERGEDLLLAPIDRKGGSEKSLIYSYLSGVQKDKERLEQTRLFYVAATRAKKRLYLFGHVKAGNGEIDAASRSLLSDIGHTLSPGLVKGPEGAGPKDASKDDIAGKTTLLRLKRLPMSWKAPEPGETIAIGKVEAEKSRAGEQRPVFDWAGEGVRHLGTVVHRYFCRIIGDGVSKWGEKEVRLESQRMVAMLRELGLNRADASDVAEKSMEVLMKALEDERGRWVLKGHADGSAELPLTGVVNGEVTRVIIDRTFVDDDGVRWIIDYKTGGHKGGSTEDFLDSEKERYKGQLERYEAILKAGGEKRKIKKGLYYPALPGWVEW